jgi:peroxiredoxin
MKKYTLILIAAGLFAVGCSNDPEPLQTVVSGSFTVADSLDEKGDYSGIGLTIVSPDSSGALSDTLFNEETDQSGAFEGSVLFPENRYYTLFISRNDVDLGSIGVILADQDSLFINGKLPNLNESLTLSSREHDAMKTLVRVDKNFERVSAYARSGALADSQILDEVKKWSDLYWEVYNNHENTIASYLAAEKSADLLNQWNQEEMLNRIDQTLPEPYMISVALNLAKPYIAKTKGFYAASRYLDSLAEISNDEMISEIVKRDKIQMYFDSSRVDEAKVLLTDYEDEYSSSSSKKWVRRIRYDLNYLAPGVTAPDFSFITLDGDTISNQSLKGDVYILEISPLANAEYQNDYDRTMVIHEIYKNYGLKIFTIPLDQSELTVEGFFEERRKAWSVAKLGSFDTQDVLQKFNVDQVPTRLLIDKNGVLIRKYERNEFEEVIQGLNQAFKENNSPS